MKHLDKALVYIGFLTAAVLLHNVALAVFTLFFTFIDDWD